MQRVAGAAFTRARRSRSPGAHARQARGGPVPAREGDDAGLGDGTLVSAMALGADCLDDCDVLRSGRTATVLGHEVLAPSTSETFCARSRCRSVCQLERVLGVTLRRAPGGRRRAGLVAFGRRCRFVRRRGLRPQEQRAAFGYTPFVATTRSSRHAMSSGTSALTRIVQ
ncbi:MAG: hypothetical protein LC777_04110 [Actinobacteria bacterium]|nr:hypothetical protein [Actinomycetota bacterium]